MSRIFIDGSAGTTGLSIRKRLAARPELKILTIPEEKRKNIDARLEMIYNADVAFLCLPDDASKEIAELAKGAGTVIIDTSTAHRTAEGWTYGLPELAGQREKIKKAKRIANPGCHATGYIVLTAPLIKAGFISDNAFLSCTSLTGYSGGGKKMIAAYEADQSGVSTNGTSSVDPAEGAVNDVRDKLLDAPRLYGLSQNHKHIPEMVKYSGIQNPPVFLPIVSDFYSGMEVVIPCSGGLIPEAAGPEDLAAIYRDYYGSGGVIRVRQSGDEEGFLSACRLSGRDDLEISIFGKAGSIILTARYDNLGKGASGAAIQNMNIALGYEETSGLVIS